MDRHRVELGVRRATASTATKHAFQNTVCPDAFFYYTTCDILEDERWSPRDAGGEYNLVQRPRRCEEAAFRRSGVGKCLKNIWRFTMYPVAFCLPARESKNCRIPIAKKSQCECRQPVWGCANSLGIPGWQQRNFSGPCCERGGRSRQDCLRLQCPALCYAAWIPCNEQSMETRQGL